MNTLKTKQNIPSCWETKYLGDVLKIGSGKDHKYLQDGNIPVFGTGGLMRHVDTPLHEGETVFIGRKGTIDKPFYFEGKFWTVDTLFYTHSYKDTSAKFINYVFQKINWLSYNEASGVPSLSKTTIEKIPFNCPSLPEQKRIVSVLETWDQAIEKLKRKIEIKKEVKKGLVNGLIKGHIRLPKSDGIRHTISLGEIGKVSMCKRILKSQTKEFGDVPFYKIGTFGKEPDAFISKEVYDKYKQAYSFPKKGEVIISAAGTIGRTVVYDGKPAYFQDSNLVWISNNEKQVLNLYLFYAYNLVEWQTASGTIARLYNDLLRSIEINAPSIDEQKTIVELLTTADTEMEDLKTKLKLIQDQKKYLLNNLVTGKIRTPETLSAFK